MHRLAGGDLTTDVIGADRRDELGGMAKAVQVFKEAGIEKVRLEGVTADARKAADAERERATAEKERVAGLARHVLADVGQSLSALSQGDLTSPVSAAIPVEVANMQPLKDDINAALDQLRKALTLVASSAGGIRSGTGEIGQAADDLSPSSQELEPPGNPRRFSFYLVFLFQLAPQVGWHTNSQVPAAIPLPKVRVCHPTRPCYTSM